MRRMTLAAAAMVLFSSTVGHADQAAWVAKDEADRAATFIKVGGGEVREYCRPCGETVYTPIRVSSVAVAKVEDEEDFYEVLLNTQGVDLAYEYVLTKGHWMNLAILAGVQVVDVPNELPTQVPRKK